VTLAEELERRKIAENLHERIGQTLAVSRMKLGVLREAIPTAELVRELDDIRELIGETIQDARSLTFELSPPVLHEVGLMAGLEWLVEKFDAQSDIDFQFRNDGKNPILDDNIRMLLFRAVRELLFNVASHSRATTCVVEIFEDGENVHVGVEDDGVGFDLEQVDGSITEPSGFGLFSIRERMNHLGGKFMVDSKPGKGARVAIVSPRKYGRKQFSEKAGT
jgi:signal transduction histidine kinase